MNTKISEIKDLTSLADLNVQLITEKHESEMELLEEQSAHQKARQKLILVISTLIALFLLHLWIQTNRKRKKERQEFEKERSKSIEQLNIFRQRIREKNELLEKVKNELQEKNKEQNKSEEKSEVVQQLSEAIILTEDDWTQFKRLFEQVYPNFLPKVRKEFPELTLAEIRFLALLEMGLNVTEMANTLAILPQSVRKTRQRLMKKLSLSHQKELRQFIANI
jgi:DNA-binding CsgD family transcriptional regulator